MFFFVVGASATMRTSSARTLAVLPPAASTRRVVRPFAGAVKFTLARWKYVPCRSEAATWSLAVERSTATDFPPIESVVCRVFPGWTSMSADAV